MSEFSTFVSEVKSRLASARDTSARGEERLAAVGGEVDSGPPLDSRPESDSQGSADSRRTADSLRSSLRQQAAVALVLRGREGEPEMLVIKRSESERDHWSGHLALPGGRMEPEDADLVETAVRETFEEVGLDLRAGGEVVGRLGTVTPRSPLAPQIYVTPFVAVAPREYHVVAGEEAKELTLSSEVAAAFWLPVSELKMGGRSEVFRMVFAGVEREWPAYPSLHGPIWGITERILTEFLSLIE